MNTWLASVMTTITIIGSVKNTTGIQWFKITDIDFACIMSKYFMHHICSISALTYIVLLLC